MTDEPTPDATLDLTEGETTVEPTTPPSPEGQGDPSPAEAPDYFGENFNPELLPPEVQPAYKQLRGAWTKKTQEIAPYRRFFEDRGITPDADPQSVFSALAEELGYQLEDDDETADDQAPDDPDQPGFDDPLEARVRAIEAERQAEVQRQADLASLGEDLDRIRERVGRDLTDDEIEFYGSHARRDQRGRLGILGVFEAHQKLLERHEREQQQKWAQSKQAPAMQPGGQPGVTTVDLDDPEQRLAYSAQILQQGIQDQ